MAGRGTAPPDVRWVQFAVLYKATIAIGKNQRVESQRFIRALNGTNSPLNSILPHSAEARSRLFRRSANLWRESTGGAKLGRVADGLRSGLECLLYDHLFVNIRVALTSVLR